MAVRSREFYLGQADSLLRKPTYTHEDDARIRALHAQATLVSPANGHGGDDGELEKWEAAVRNVRSGGETRDLGIAAGSAGYLVPVGFRELLEAALKQYDELFDVVTKYETERGGPVTVPSIDDVTSSAVVVAEGVAGVEADPTAGALMLPNATTWRSGRVACSYEFLQDSGFPVSEFLADAFAVRFARGVGAYLATTLVSSAAAGPTAVGDVNSGGSGGTSVGYEDLLALRKSVDPAYRRSPKCCWAMNDDTLTALDGLLDKNGRPILDAGVHSDSDGRRLILGYPVLICPSLDSIGVNKKPILFGAMNFFVLRTVPQATALRPYTDAPNLAEYGKVAFQGYYRGNAGLLNAGSSSPPIKYLQNAATAMTGAKHSKNT